MVALFDTSFLFLTEPTIIIGSFAFMGPGLCTSAAMDHFDLYRTMVGINARNLGQGNALIMLLNAYSFDASRATTCLGLGTPYTRLRYSTSDLFGDTTREGSSFGLAYSVLYCGLEVGIKLLSFCSVSRGIFIFARFYFTCVLRLLSLDATLASGRAKLDTIGISTSSLKVSFSFSLQGTYKDGDTR